MQTNIPGQLDGALPVGVRMETLRGEPRQAGGAMVTPIARRLTLRWPGGGRVSARPSAVEIQTVSGVRRVRIMSFQRVALAMLAGITLATLAGAVAQWWLNQRMETTRRSLVTGEERHDMTTTSERLAGSEQARGLVAEAPRRGDAGAHAE